MSHYAVNNKLLYTIICQSLIIYIIQTYDYNINRNYNILFWLQGSLTDITRFNLITYDL